MKVDEEVNDWEGGDAGMCAGGKGSQEWDAS